MKKVFWNRMFSILIVAVPLGVIAALLYAKVLQLQAHRDIGTHLLINEVVADNLSTLKDENGVYADWIELYNPTDHAIDLKGYYLSDSKNELTKWAFPDVCIESGGYLIVFCDGTLEEGTLHTNFLINAGKETIYLSDANENVIDSMKLEDQQCDISYGRMYANADAMGFLPYSTPLEPNPAYFTQNKRAEADWGAVRFSLEGGRYDGDIEVELSCDVEDAAILYTLDGSEPDINSFVYDKPIKITDEGGPNQYTTKKCVMTPSSNADNAETQYGVNEVYKGTVIRARIVKDAKLSTSVQTNSYFVNSDYSLPIVSLTTDPYELFDDSDGAYVLGYTYYTMKKYGGSSRRINSNMPRDIVGHVEIYDTDGSVFEDDITFAIAGKSSISRNIQKSFNVVLEHKKITGDMFGTSNMVSYERFTLRGPGSGVVKENLYAYSSAFASNFISDDGVGAQKNRFCILFIDGEYWGIYSLMEPKGKEYIHNRTGAAKKDITLVIPWKNISAKEFDELFEAIRARDFYQEADYEWIKTEINVDNFIEFVFAEAFFGNTDAVSNGDHNLHIWKEKGGLWNWYLFDFDCTMVDNENYLKEMLELGFGDSAAEEKKNFSAWLFQRLWRCEAFRNDFTTYVRHKCSTVYTKENVTAAFEQHTKAYAAEMQENLLRCEMGYTKLKQLSFAVRGIDAAYQNFTMEQWKTVVNDIYRFLSGRTARVLEFLDELEQEGYMLPQSEG